MSFADKPVYDFHDRMQASKPYEDRLMGLLESMPEVERVERASYDDDKNKGIDLWIYPTNGTQPIAMQVKTDFNTNRTGNITFETVSQAYTDKAGKVGWGLTLDHADRIAFIVPKWDVAYIFHSDQYVRWCLENYKELIPKSVKNEGYLTLISLVPLKDVAGMGIEYKLPPLMCNEEKQKEFQMARI